MLGSHYEVKGSAIAAGVAAPYTQPAATPFTGQPGGRFAFATRAQPQQHQPQQPQQQQQPQPQPQFRRPVSRTFQRFLISHCNISSIMIVNFKKIYSNLWISNLKLNVMINADKIAFIKKEYVLFKHLFLSMRSFFTQEHQPRGAAGNKSASYTDLLPAAHRGRMQHPCGDGEAAGADGQ